MFRLLVTLSALLIVLTKGNTVITRHYRPNEPCRRDEGHPPHQRKYILHPERVTWFEAKDICDKEKGALAFPENCHQIAALRALLAASTNSTVTNELHAGFFRPDYFVTVFGTSLFESGYQRWAPGQERHQICGTFNHNILLYDAKCLDERSFICEVWPRANDRRINITTAPILAPPSSNKLYQPSKSTMSRPYLYPPSIFTTISPSLVPQPSQREYMPLMQQGRMHWYVHSDKMRWSEASRRCQLDQGHLLILDHQMEADVLKSYIKEKALTDSIYIGYRNGQNLFVTLFGTVVQDGWEREQPDDETCLAINHEMLLHKVPCWHTLDFICELVLTGPPNL